MEAYIFLFVNLVFFISLWVSAYKRLGAFCPSTFVLFMWILSAIGSILYYASGNAYEGLGKYSILSALTLIILFGIYMYPLSNLNFFKEGIPYYSNFVVTILTIILALIAYLPFIENIFHLFNGRTLYEMGSYHDELDHTVVTATSHLSAPGRIMAILLGRCRYIVPVLFFNYINKNNPKIRGVIVIGLICALFNPSIQSFSVGARNIVAQDFIFIIFMFLLFLKSFNKTIRKRFLICFGAFAVIAIIGSVIITIFRFGDNEDESTMESIYRYVGEGYINFYTDMWYNDTLTWGKNIFRSQFDIGYYELSKLTHLRMHVYYTFIGDFLCDFGLPLTVLIIMFVSYKMKKIINDYMNNKICPSGITALVLYITVILSGFMYTPFMNTGIAVIYAFIFMFITAITPVHYRIKNQ